MATELDLDALEDEAYEDGLSPVKVSALIARIRELEARAAASVVPEGWKLVPVEPTAWMQTCIEDAWQYRGDPASVWMAGVQAAPQPPAPEAQGDVARDAARWRYLRDGESDLMLCRHAPWDDIPGQKYPGCDSIPCEVAEYDAAIDAAMQKGESDAG